MAGKKGYAWPCLENVYFVNNLQKTACQPLKFIYVLDFGLIRIIYEDTMTKFTRIEIKY